MYRRTSMPKTNMVQPQGDSSLYVVTKADVNIFSQMLTGLTEGHLTLEAALGLCWLVLPVLPSWNAEKTFRGLKT